MQLSDIIADVRARIQEPQASTWTDAQITGWINRGMDDLSEIAAYEKTVQMSSVSGQTQYALPTDCLRDGLRRITWNVPQGSSSAALIPVRFMGRDDFDMFLLENGNTQQSSPIGFPPIYTVWGGNFYLLPLPVTSGTNDLNLYYYAQLPYLANNSDVPIGIPPNRHEVLVLYATARSYEMIGESNYFAEYMQQYETVKSMIEDEVTSNQRDMPRMVRDVYSGWW